MASERIVGVESVASALSDVLDGYSDAVIAAASEEARKSACRLAAATRKSAPVGTRRATHYRTHISSRLLRHGAMGDSYVWYVKGKDARLSHLLERDHATYHGRASGTHFIERALDEEERTFVSCLRRAIRDVSR